MKNALSLILILYASVSFAQVSLTEAEVIGREIIKEYQNLAHISFTVDADNTILPTGGKPALLYRNTFKSVDDKKSGDILVNKLFLDINGINTDLFILGICHELGHALAGGPQMTVYSGLMFTEGEADYFATNSCFKKIAHNIASDIPNSNSAISFCNLNPGIENCERTATTIESMATVLLCFQDTIGCKGLSLYSKSSTIADVTLVSGYPDVACRVQTMVNGLLNLEKPNCWFKN